MLKKKKAEDAAYKTFVINHIRNIFGVANLDDFDIGVASLTKDDTEDDNVSATMDVDYEYLRATIKCSDKWFKERYEEGSYYTLLNVLCHESAHVITSELPDLVGLDYKGDMKFYLERMTERVGRIIHRLYSQWMTDNKINIQTGK
jgi:hypothetical protein